MNILFTVDLKVAVTVVVIRQETGTSRGPKLKNAGLLALPWLLCITVLVIGLGNQTRDKDQQRTKIEKCWSVGLALAPLYYCTSIKTRDRDQQRPKIEKCWSVGLAWTIETVCQFVIICLL